MMLMFGFFCCLFSLAASGPIVQKDVLDEAVLQKTLDLTVQQTNMPVIYTTTHLLPSQDSVVPQHPVNPAVPDVLRVPAEGQQIGPVQTAAHSSSESETSEQSESVETPTEEAPDNTSENTTSEESDADTSEQTSESQDVTSEDTTSEKTPSPLEIQIPEHNDVDGDLKDDSHGSEESVRRSWLHTFRRNYHQQIYGGNIMGGVATGPPITMGTIAVGAAVGVGVVSTVAPAVNIPEPTAAATDSVDLETDSAASQSKESEEQAELQEWHKCIDMTDNGDCTPHGAVNDGHNLYHGAVQLEEDHGHMTI